MPHQGCFLCPEDGNRFYWLPWGFFSPQPASPIALRIPTETVGQRQPRKHLSLPAQQAWPGSAENKSASAFRPVTHSSNPDDVGLKMNRRWALVEETRETITNRENNKAKAWYSSLPSDILLHSRTNHYVSGQRRNSGLLIPITLSERLDKLMF